MNDDIAHDLLTALEILIEHCRLMQFYPGTDAKSLAGAIAFAEQAARTARGEN